METNRIANIIYNMALDMDYADYLDCCEMELQRLAIELDLLKLKNSMLFSLLESIALQNEALDM